MIKRKEEFNAYDICDCDYYDVIALEDEEDGCVKTEFEMYIIYAQFMENVDGEDNGDIEGSYWEIDTGDCH